MRFSVFPGPPSLDFPPVRFPIRPSRDSGTSLGVVIAAVTLTDAVLSGDIWTKVFGVACGTAAVVVNNGLEVAGMCPLSSG